LSPYIRHRVVTETELLRAVLERHTRGAADKFIQEIFWRTYWKGWLQSHPAAWKRYWSTLSAQLHTCAIDDEKARAYAAAIAGETGIAAFDAWARELVATNYLHNHARMWFASIWIFTLRLPWELGADFFMRHLLDGDPAANTLSWRWVAGLQTRGKTYAATDENIRRYTENRFEPSAALARSTPALDDAVIPLVPLRPLTVAPADPQPTLLAVHDDDLLGDLGDLPPSVRGVCAVRAAGGRSPQPVSPAVAAFSDALGVEAATRLAAATGGVDLGLIASTDAPDIAAALVATARAAGASRIAVPFAPVGPVRDLLDACAPIIADGGLAYAEIGRRYDALSWPACTRGFFNLRARIPTLIAELGLGPG
jgi:deoxyribodipyrimidine photo-lyase